MPLASVPMLPAVGARDCVSSFFFSVMSLLIARMVLGLPSASRTNVQCPSTMTSRPSFVNWRSSPSQAPFSIIIPVASTNCDNSPGKSAPEPILPTASSAVQPYKRSAPRPQ